MRLLLIALLVCLGLRLPAEMQVVEEGEGDGDDGIGAVLKPATDSASTFGQPLPPSQQQSRSFGLGPPPQQSGFGGGGAHEDDDGLGPALSSVESAVPPEAVDSSVAVADDDPTAGVDPVALDADPAGLGGPAASPAEPRPAPATTETKPPPAPKTKKRSKKRKHFSRTRGKMRHPPKVPWYKNTQPILYDFPPVKKRLDFIKHLEKLPAFATAVEVGVGKGMLAKGSLELWASCTEYKLVDVWEQKKQLGQVQYRVKPWPEKTEFLVLPSAAAAARLADAHFDYVYLDVRRDYCAMAEELARYWPKLRPGGILGGGGYVEAPPKDWGACEDGSVRPKAAKGAVDDFRKEQSDLDIYISNEKLPSWYIQKPY